MIPGFVQRWFGTFGLLTLGVFMPMQAVAESKARAIDEPLGQMQHLFWGPRDGAPTYCWAISQTTDGWMWFGGTAGLFRFDGARFERVDSQPEAPERSQGISELLALPGGDLMIGYRAGGVGVMHDGHVRNYHEADGLDAATTFTMARSRDGRLWAGTRTGLSVFEAGRWHPIGEDRGLARGRVNSLLLDGAGALWASGENGIFVLAPTALRFQQARPDEAELVPDRHGNAWALDETGMHALLRQDHGATPQGEFVKSNSSGQAFDRSDRIWMVGARGLSRFGRAEDVPPASRSIAAFETRTPVDDRLAMPGILTLFPDREGNFWMGGLDGIHLLRRTRLVQRSIPGSSQRFVLSAAATDDGAIWATSYVNTPPGEQPAPSVFRCMDGQDCRSFANPVRAGFDYRRADGTIAILGDTSLWRSDGSRLLQELELPAQVAANPVEGAVETDGGRTPWISMRGHGLFARRDGAWVANGGVPELPSSEATALAVADDGTLWIGYVDGSVFIVSQQHARRVPNARSASLGAIRSIGLGSATLVGGERGLAILQGERLQSIEAVEPAAFGLVSGIQQTAAGDVWLNSGVGAVRVPASEVSAATRGSRAPLEVQVLGRDDGYPGEGTISFFMGRTLVRAPDGRLWFSGDRGLGWIDPTRTQPAEAPHPVLRGLVADGRRVDITPAVSLQAGTRGLQIDYGALNYARPAAQVFRFRLVGLDAAWTDAGTRRSAFFTNLGPGRYRFELVSRNEDLVWTTNPVTLEVEIPPTFVQSWTFRALCAVLASLALFAWMRWRIKRETLRILGRERERLEVRMDERERIARELHDTLLQSTQALVLKVGAAIPMMRRGQPVEHLLEEVASSGNAAVVEARERIQDLRQSRNGPVDLRRELQEIGERLASEPGSALFELDAQTIDLPPGVADEVLCIAREALLNAYRHAHASHVAVELARRDGDVVVRVRDDGIGLHDSLAGPRDVPGHWGLPGMRERVKRLGGKLDISTRAGIGTTITVTVPVAHADNQRTGRSQGGS